MGKLKRNSLGICEKCGKERVLYSTTKNNMYGMVLCYTCKRNSKPIGVNRLEKNMFVADGDDMYMLLVDNVGREKARTLIDTEDIPRISKYKWGITNSGYVSTVVYNPKKTIMLHKLVMNTDETVDHIRGNPLDNRKSMLRVVTQMQNTWNSKTRGDNKLGHRGIKVRKRKSIPDKFGAYITVNKKDIWLGTYDTLDKAILARKAAEIKYYGMYRCQHDVD